jgi:hypothetical protein
MVTIYRLNSLRESLKRPIILAFTEHIAASKNAFDFSKSQGEEVKKNLHLLHFESIKQAIQILIDIPFLIPLIICVVAPWNVSRVFSRLKDTKLTAVDKRWEVFKHGLLSFYDWFCLAMVLLTSSCFWRWRHFLDVLRRLKKRDPNVKKINSRSECYDIKSDTLYEDFLLDYILQCLLEVLLIPILAMGALGFWRWGLLMKVQSKIESQMFEEGRNNYFAYMGLIILDVLNFILTIILVGTFVRFGFSSRLALEERKRAKSFQNRNKTIILCEIEGELYTC